MNEVIKSFVKTVSDKPGVYKMLSPSSDVLYIGKAKNLKNRLQQYLRPLSNRLQKMVIQVTDIDIIITKNEIEALILESKLIKDLQPKYNILLKDDKSYPYILITKKHKFPRLMKYRGKYQKYCYGPFPSAEKLDNMMSVLYKTFQLRSCSDQNFSSRKRPCLEYQIKRCSAPCVGKISSQDYNQSVKQAENILQGKKNNVENELKDFMNQASEKLDYELALVYRNRIRSLKYLNVHQGIIENADVIAVYKNENLANIQIASFSDSNLQSQYLYTMDNVIDSTENEIMNAFIMQFYQNFMPREIISNYQVSNETSHAIERLFNKKVAFHKPKKGRKFEMLQSLYNDVKRNFHVNNCKYFLNLLKERFFLNENPERVEVYDNSHISGDSPIGVMIVVDKTGFNKSEYRSFNIRNNTSDDYFMMKEVLTRRMKDTRKQPDFILIDGGKGHMSVAKDILTDIQFACIAKGEKRNSGDETFHTIDHGSFKLEKDSMLLYFLERIRDEAHRFAISNHRAKRSKSIKKSILDEIPKIGNKRKKLLLTYFGSVIDIRQATIKQLSSVNGISTVLAELISAHLNQS